MFCYWIAWVPPFEPSTRASSWPAFGPMYRRIFLMAEPHF